MDKAEDCLGLMIMCFEFVMVSDYGLLLYMALDEV